MSRFAHDIVIDHVKKEIRIEGVALPYYIEADPEVETMDGYIGIVRLGIYADNVTVITSKGREVVRSAPMADELVWARQMARETVAAEMAPVLKWLRAAA